MIDKNSLSHTPRFLDLNNVIHIDEKLFYISKTCEKYYLLAEESDHVRRCKSKNSLTKIMFLATIEQPRFDEDGNEIFFWKNWYFPVYHQGTC